MKNREQKKINRRTTILALFCVLWLIVLIFRLIQLQVIDSSDYIATKLKQNQDTSAIIPERGTIFDRNGTILARSIPAPSIAFRSSGDESPSVSWEKIQRVDRILHLSREELKGIKERIEKKLSFSPIKKRIDPDTAKLVDNLGLSGIFIEKENKRFYPHGKLASHLIGRVHLDGNGASGIELKYDAHLLGTKGKRLVFLDANGRDYLTEVIEQPVPGKDLILTIDETIQYIAEKELAKTVEDHQAKWGVVIVSDPSTGDILALANFPTFDLNHPPSSEAGLFEAHKIKAIHHLFDPGSTFKIITAAAALETGSVRLEDVFDCSIPLKMAWKRYKDHEEFGRLSFPEVIIHSSNIGTIQIGQRIGEENLYGMIQNFGFGQKTGVDLPAEYLGILHPLKEWGGLSLTSLSIGYEISVTAMQMLQTVNIIANRGVTVQPRVVKAMILSEDKIEEPPREYRRVLREDIAQCLTGMLAQVVEAGTGINARIDGYSIAGKTGTAQKFDPETGYYSSRSHTASFVGFAPAEAPLFSMVVVIDEPVGQFYGGEVAAPLFQRIAKQIFLYYRIPPQHSSPLKLVTADKRREPN
jgi:cell division protein FtsI/penicillin-binding protein 2